MAEDGQVVRAIHWREVFSFTQLFRAFRIATHPSKLALALAALVLLYCGGRVLDSIWPNNPTPEEIGVYSVTAPEMQTDDMWHQGIFIRLLEFEVSQVNRVTRGVLTFNWLGHELMPGGESTGDVVGGVINFLISGPAFLWHYHPLYALLYTTWFLIIWSIFGGAIARIAAVDAARDEKISVRQALRFSIGKVLSFLFAPLIPIIIVLGIGAVLAAAGWILLHISYLGPIVLGSFFFLALIGGAIVTLAVLGTIGGFSLMYPSIAVEGSDSFDAISRSFSYVYQRPWRMLFLTAIAIIYGALTYLFARFFIWVWLMLTHGFLGWWLHGEPSSYWNGENFTGTSIWPAPDFWHLSYAVHFENLKWSEALGAGLISFWVYLIIALLGAYAISYFFSSNTIIYLLMRREVDATELDDVYIEEMDEDFSEALPPVTESNVGTAASDVTAGGMAPGLGLPPDEANNT